jgi:DNA modification methylase
MKPVAAAGPGTGGKRRIVATIARKSSSGTLTRTEKQRRNELEKVIARGQKAFIEVGEALIEIRESRLYRDTHPTFDAYVQERWTIRRSRAYQLIDAAEMSTRVDIAGLPAPESEKHIRPLKQLPPEKQPEAWRRAVETAPVVNGRPHLTAARVGEVVEEVIDEDAVLRQAKQIRERKLAEEREQRRQRKRRELAERAKANGHVARNGRPAADQRWEVIRGDCLGGVIEHDVRPRLIFCDPVYNIGIDYGHGAKADRRSPEEYLAWCREWIEMCAEILQGGDGSLWVLINDEWAAEYGVMLKRSGFTIRSWIKLYESFGVNCTDKFNRTSRHLFYCVINPRRYIFHADAPQVRKLSARQTKYNDARANADGKVWDDVWGVEWDDEDHEIMPPIPRIVGTSAERLPEFPTQLPLALLRPIIACATDPGDLVLDPMAGSMTTGHAAIELGRRFLGVELEERWVTLGRQRLAGVVGPQKGNGV